MIHRLEQPGILKKETEPTDRISNLVAAKRPGKLEIWINHRNLNIVLKTLKFQVPTIEEILPNLQILYVHSAHL